MMEKKQTSTILKWIARFASLGTFLFVGTFVVGEFTSGNGQIPTSTEWLGLLLFPVGLLVGLALAWKNSLAGGAVAIASVAAFYVWSYSRSGSWPSGPWFLILAAPAVAFILSAMTDSGHDQTRHPGDGNQHRTAMKA